VDGGGSGGISRNSYQYHSNHPFYRGCFHPSIWGEGRGGDRRTRRVSIQEDENVMGTQGDSPDPHRPELTCRFDMPQLQEVLVVVQPRLPCLPIR
jgi:hypothetical protein